MFYVSICRDLVALRARCRRHSGTTNFLRFAWLTVGSWGTLRTGWRVLWEEEQEFCTACLKIVSAISVVLGTRQTYEIAAGHSIVQYSLFSSTCRPTKWACWGKSCLSGLSTCFVFETTKWISFRVCTGNRYEELKYVFILLCASTKYPLHCMKIKYSLISFPQYV